MRFHSGFRRCWSPLAQSRSCLRRGLTGWPTRGPGAYLAAAAGAALAVVVFAALRPSSGYYRLRPFEASGKFYARLGVRFFRRFVPLGDYFNRLTRRRNPDFRVVRSPADLAKAERSGRLFERIHVTFLVSLLPLTCWGLVCGQYGFAAELIVFNVLINLYPAMLQRYTRARLEALARRRDRLQNHCGRGWPNQPLTDGPYSLFGTFANRAPPVAERYRYSWSTFGSRTKTCRNSASQASTPATKSSIAVQSSRFKSIQLAALNRGELFLIN